MYEPGYCSLLLLLFKRKLTTFSKDNIRYDYNVSVLKEQTSSNSSVPDEYGGGYIQTILFCLFGFIQLMNKMICISQMQHKKIVGFQMAP